MESFFTIVKWIGLGFVGLLVALVLLAVVFGKRVIKKWELEAEFRDDSGREFGEFDIEMSRIDKKEPEFSLKAGFHMRHESLREHQTVQVFVDDLLVLEGMANKPGWIRLNNDNLVNEITDAKAGQLCRIVVGGAEMFAEELVPD